MICVCASLCFALCVCFSVCASVSVFVCVAGSAAQGHPATNQVWDVCCVLCVLLAAGPTPLFWAHCSTE